MQVSEIFNVIYMVHDPQTPSSAYVNRRWPLPPTYAIYKQKAKGTYALFQGGRRLAGCFVHISKCKSERGSEMRVFATIRAWAHGPWANQLFDDRQSVWCQMAFPPLVNHTIDWDRGLIYQQVNALFGLGSSWFWATTRNNSDPDLGAEGSDGPMGGLRSSEPTVHIFSRKATFPAVYSIYNINIISYIHIINWATWTHSRCFNANELFNIWHDMIWVICMI